MRLVPDRYLKILYMESVNCILNFTKYKVNSHKRDATVKIPYNIIDFKEKVVK